MAKPLSPVPVITPSPGAVPAHHTQCYRIFLRETISHAIKPDLKPHPLHLAPPIHSRHISFSTHVEPFLARSQPGRNGRCDGVLFWWHRSIEGNMDLLHITPRTLPRVSYLPLKISPTVPFRSRSFVLHPPQFCIYSTTLYVSSPRVLSALLSFLPSPFHYSPLEHMSRKCPAEDYNRTGAGEELD
jgi:hypothetical protein